MAAAKKQPAKKEVSKEMKEHPWASKKVASKIASDHTKKAPAKAPAKAPKPAARPASKPKPPVKAAAKPKAASKPAAKAAAKPAAKKAAGSTRKATPAPKASTSASKRTPEKAPSQAPKRGRGRPRNEAKAKAEAERKAKVAEEIKAGLRSKSGRGRPRKAENVEKEKAIAKKRAARAKEGKSARGREVKKDSVRSLRKTRETTRAKDFAKKTKGSKPLTPEQVRKTWHKLPKFDPGDSPMPERGGHKRGKTTVSYGAGGGQKYQRREFTFKGKGKKEASKVTIFRAMRHDKDSGRYVPHRSVRDYESKSRLHSETVDHSKAGKTTRVTGRIIGGRGYAHERSTKKHLGPTPGSLEHISAQGRSALAATTHADRQIGGSYRGSEQEKRHNEKAKAVAQTAKKKVFAKKGEYEPKRPDGGFHSGYRGNRYTTSSTLKGPGKTTGAYAPNKSHYVYDAGAKMESSRTKRAMRKGKR